MKATLQIVRPCGIIAAVFALGLARIHGAEATTDPVGIIDISVAGGTPASPKLSLISPTLTRPVLWQGTVTVVSGTTITVGAAPWTASQFNGVNGSHYVEIISATDGTKSGVLSDITATTAATITTADNLEIPNVFVAIGDSIKIRKHVTIADVFGANNSAGLKTSNDATTADEVLVYNGSTPSVYWYYNGNDGGDAGWYDLSFNPSGGVAIGPNDGVVVKRKEAGNRTFTVAGAVKTGNTLIPIQNGLNVLGTASAKGLTLATSGLVSGNAALKTSDDASTADEVIIYSPNSQATYWYYDGTQGGDPGWYDLLFAPSGTVSIAPGSAFVVKRKGGAAFNWALPSPTSF